MNQNYSERPFPPSLWHATATPAPLTPPIQESAHTSVVIIGAGYTGLSMALHLAEKGVDVIVLDAEQPGWGASGRNGGQVIPGLKYDPDELVSRFGAKWGEALIRLSGAAADTVFDLIDKYQISCDAVRKGWIQTAHSQNMMRVMERRASQWARRGAPVQLLDQSAVAQRIGTGGFMGGWIDSRAGSVQPLSYARGLARAAQGLGVQIYGQSRATRISKVSEGWQVAAGHGATVTASQVLIATNGYTDGLWPSLRQTVLAANSFLVATPPLSDEQGAAILPGREVSSDSRRLLVYFRRDAQGRLVLGGRGPFSNPQGTSEWAHIERALELLFPQLKGIAYEYRWAGRVAVTADFMPHVHQPAPGLHIALGYNGRGIAMATTMGKVMAEHIAGDPTVPLPYPVTAIKPIPFHHLQRFYMAAGVAWYRLLDALS
ncbi:FAD-binding oxidoreductase [Pusillimonas sp. SM2304]|uniref:NAD(P)/FAD-dependent oxidoreductase n=1 Tax=Pusillimonas sp. SM2304 TaxID=3073241 RepID=UPI0028768D74|nr:FAD-binding oxidoreductase [Pusillimonas sp. SM2304]MDS1139196.1 FAD-binding oxidoreductase [Pusillimonas sp. SM2304]